MPRLDLSIIGLAVTLEPLRLTLFIKILGAERGSRKGLALLLAWLACLVVVFGAVVLFTSRLCGAAPLDASSGKQQRHRLSPAGDRQANSALWRIVITLFPTTPQLAATSNVDVQKERPNPKPSAASSATSHGSSRHAFHEGTCLTAPRSINPRPAAHRDRSK